MNTHAVSPLAQTHGDALTHTGKFIFCPCIALDRQQEYAAAISIAVLAKRFSFDVIVILLHILVKLVRLRTSLFGYYLHTSALRIGTHFLLTLETVVFLFHLLSTTSKPFSSLSTS